jgi:heme/copper-type cytochrome/quinol oxidase subunit 3
MSETTAIHPESTHTGLDNRKLGMWIFLASEVMLFSALIGALLTIKAGSPPDANHVLNVPVTAINTFVLIISSTTVVLGLQSIQDGNKARLLYFLMATLALGATFLSVQVIEYRNLILDHGFTPSSSPFAGIFYTVTGLHGFHVFCGLIACAWLIAQAVRQRFTAEEHGRVEVFGLYWHFVDVVWIVLFTIVYLM